MKLVLIEWEDSFGVGPSWEPISDILDDVPAMICRSVGWLVRDTEKVKVVVPHMHDANDEIGATQSGCGDMTIPTSCVVRMVELLEAQ